MNRSWKKGSRSVGLAGVALFTLATFTIAEDAADKESKALEGTWKFVSLRADDQDAPKDVIEKWRWTFRDQMILMPAADGASKASYTVDPTKSPKTFDMTSLDAKTKGKTFLCIYKLESDRLTICVPEGRGESTDPTRPKEFSGGSGRSLFVLERVVEK